MKNLAMTALRFLAMASTFACTLHLFGQDIEEPREHLGTTAYSLAPDLSSTTVAVSVKPILVERQASYTTGGVSLRNRGAGNINMSGLVGPSRLTLLYWAVITNGETKVPVSQIEIQRFFPVPASAAAIVNGVVVGVGPAPCWGPAGSKITVFRAVVPPAIAGVGNGSYQLTLIPGSGGLVNGQDPWAPPVVLPLWEGASLVMIGNGAGTVSVFDVGLAGDTFAPNVPFNYTLNLPLLPIAGHRMLLDNIGADGQHVAVLDRHAVLGYSDEQTTVNGFPIAGPGSQYNDSDWNGSSGLPVTELWDDTGHDITNANATSAAPGNILNIRIFDPVGGAADCLTPVANVVQE